MKGGLPPEEATMTEGLTKGVGGSLQVVDRTMTPHPEGVGTDLMAEITMMIEIDTKAEIVMTTMVIAMVIAVVMIGGSMTDMTTMAETEEGGVTLREGGGGLTIGTEGEILEGPAKEIHIVARWTVTEIDPKVSCVCTHCESCT